MGQLVIYMDMSCIILMCVRTGCYTPTPRNVAPVRMPRLWFAIKLIARQLMIKPENLHRHDIIRLLSEERHAKTDLKNAMRERDRSSPGDREEAKMARSTAGVTGIRLEFGGLVAPTSGYAAAGVVLAPACAWDAASGYGRWDETGGVETVPEVAWVAAAYVAGVMVLVLGVELVGVRLELELERTDDEGEATIVGVRVIDIDDGGGDRETCSTSGAVTVVHLALAGCPLANGCGAEC